MSTLVKMPHCWKSHATAQVLDNRMFVLGTIRLGHISICNNNMDLSILGFIFSTSSVSISVNDILIKLFE